MRDDDLELRLVPDGDERRIHRLVDGKIRLDHGDFGAGDLLRTQLGGDSGGVGQHIAVTDCRRIVLDDNLVEQVDEVVGGVVVAGVDHGDPRDGQRVPGYAGPANGDDHAGIADLGVEGTD